MTQAAAREEGESPRPITVATYNIHGAVGADKRFDPGRIASVLREIDADIVALQEVPLGGRDENVLAILSQATGLSAVESPTLYDLRRRFGNAVLTRYPVLSTRSIDISFGSREPRGALDADLVCHGRPLRVVATHLGLRFAERRDQIRRLLQVFNTHRMPVILMGDINEWFMWGSSLRRLVSHFESVPAPATFPAKLPLFALDRIWIRPRHRLVEVEVHKSALAKIASDHLPLVARIDA